MMSSLVQKYAPRGFDSLLGQPHVAEWCRRQLHQKIHQHALFCGPTGTGKTTAARMYGRGILCTGTTSDKPCDACENCISWTRGGFHEAFREISCPSRRGVAANDDLPDIISKGPIWLERQIIFLDEAQGLSRQTFDLLLKPLESPERPSTVIIATTNPERVPEAIRGRLHQLFFQPLDASTIAKALCDVCCREGLTFDTDAMVTLALLANGSHREALQRLDQLAAVTKNISPAAVNEAFNFGRVSKRVAELVLSMLDNDGQSVLDGLRGWVAEPCEKADAVQRMLLFIYLTELRRRRHADLLVGSAPVEMRFGIKSKIEEIARRRKLALEEVWQEAIQFWDPEPVITEASLFARADRFLDLMTTRP